VLHQVLFDGGASVLWIGLIMEDSVGEVETFQHGGFTIGADDGGASVAERLDHGTADATTGAGD
jgi:hypothetical protein